MATQACKDNIKKMVPPVYCPGDHCGQIQDDINVYCKHTGQGGDVPVPQVAMDGKCWCCCSCLAWGTPIEVTTGIYKMIESISTGDKVLATGSTVDDWVEREVTDVGGIAPGGDPLDFCYAAVFKMSDGTTRILISTADHLYLKCNGNLAAIQDLRPGDAVIQANGDKAIISLVSIGQFSGGVRNFSMGKYEPKKYPNDPYKGHLMNSFGLVTADLAVQSAFYSGELDQFVKEESVDIPEIGSNMFFERYDTKAYNKFMNDPQQWPRNFAPIAHDSLINIPISALAYFTVEQATDIDKSANNQNLANSKDIANFKYLKKLFQGFYPDIYYIADWTNTTSNAWYFNTADQNYIVLSGGLLRLKSLTINGISMIMSHLLAQDQGYGCSADADYWGAALFMREIWYGNLFFDAYIKASNEITEIFGMVSPEHAKENPKNICAQPSLECRLTAIKNAGSFQGVPDCAKTLPTFVMSSAEAPTLDTVRITFSADLFAGTATNPDHYAIEDVTVLQASLDAKDKKVVTLIVQNARPSISYTVIATDIISEQGTFLSKDHNSANYITPSTDD